MACHAALWRCLTVSCLCLLLVSCKDGGDLVNAGSGQAAGVEAVKPEIKPDVKPDVKIETKDGFTYRKAQGIEKAQEEGMVRIKFRRTAKGDYSWDLSGDKASDILKVNKELNEGVQKDGHAKEDGIK